MAGPLIAPEELAVLLGDVTVLDIRWQLGRTDGQEQFLAAHVPGASYVDLESDLTGPVGDGTRGRHPLPAPDRFAATMRRCGVRRDRPVVVYDDVSGTSATRAWWLLRDHGHPDVRLLDGGWSWWDRAGRAVETGKDHPEPGRFEPDPGQMAVLDPAGAAALAASGVLLDARAPVRFRGDDEPVDPVAGHIPGAVNVPTAANLEPTSSLRAGRFKPRAALAQVYAAVGALDAGQEVGAVAAYCGSGVTATHDLFALHLLGVDGALFPGSWSAWVSDPVRPVAVGD
ncbi:MAG: sulfurtransferase [Nocardioides sp.]